MTVLTLLTTQAAGDGTGVVAGVSVATAIGGASAVGEGAATVVGAAGTSAVGSASSAGAATAATTDVETTAAIGTATAAGTGVASSAGVGVVSAVGVASVGEAVVAIVAGASTTAGVGAASVAVTEESQGIGGGGSVRDQLTRRRARRKLRPAEDEPRVRRQDAAALAVGVSIVARSGPAMARASARARVVPIGSVTSATSRADGRGIHNPTDDMIAVLLAAA